MTGQSNDYLRLRQLCLVAEHLTPAVDDLAAVLGLNVCHRDEKLARYGLQNALLPVSTSFIEVVAPLKPGLQTAAGRYLARRNGNGGYMVILDTDDVSPWRTHMQDLGIRRIEDREYAGKAHLMQMHPRDTGACILEIDHHVGGADLNGNYQWAGDDWQQHVRSQCALAITGAELQSEAPEKLAAHWSEVLRRPAEATSEGTTVIWLDNACLRFVGAGDGRGEGLGGISVEVRDVAVAQAEARQRGLPFDDDTVVICGTRFRLHQAPR